MMGHQVRARERLARVEIDITRSKAFDLRKQGGVFRALMWAAATGRIGGIMASPPLRGTQDEELVAKAMWCSTVAKAANNYYGVTTPFVLFEGTKLMSYVNPQEENLVNNKLSRPWKEFTDVMFLEGQGETMVTNLDFGESTSSTTTAQGRWTTRFKETIIQAIERWRCQPEMRQITRWLAKMDAGNFLSSLTDRELEQWRIHVRNNHQPYHRNCKTCVESSGTGRRHVKIKTPSSYCLSLDVCGPFRQRGVDPDHADYRYALIGAYVIPMLQGEVRDGGPHKGEVRDGGPHESEVRDGGPHKGEVRDGGPENSCQRLSDHGVPVHGGDFEPEVVEDRGHGSWSRSTTRLA